MKELLPLIALAPRPRPAPPLEPVVVDPAYAAITTALHAAQLWEEGTCLTLKVQSDRLTVHLLVPEIEQSERLEAVRARKARAVIVSAVEELGSLPLFSDVINRDCQRGWVVVATARRKGDQS